MSQIPQTLFGISTVWLLVGLVTAIILIVGLYFMLTRPKEIPFESPPEPIVVSIPQSDLEIMDGLWSEVNVASDARTMPVGFTRRYQLANPEPLAQLKEIRKLGSRNFTASATSDGIVSITRHR